MKKNSLPFLSAAVLACMLLVGCALAPDAYRGDTVAGSDRDLASLVEQRIQNDSVAARAMVRVSVTDGIATIRGRDLSPDVMARILSIAHNTPGIRGVERSR